jgi:hypothetical protein
VTGWMHPNDQVKLGTTRPVTWGRAPWRILGYGWFINDFEVDLNKGDDVVLIDIMKQARSDVGLDLAETWEDTFLAPDGNYAHDGTGTDNLIMYGLLYAGTIDGKHIAEAGATTPAKSVFGINPGTYTAHKNPFINPVESADGLGVISDVQQLPRALDRMMKLMRFDDVASLYGPLAPNIQDAPSYDPDTPEKPGDIFLLCDDITEVVIRDIFRARQTENVGYDSANPRPTYKGIPYLGTSRLRVSPYGWGYDTNGTALWTDRGTTYASALWANWGRTLLVNTRYLHLALHPKHAPYNKDPYRPPGRFGMAMEGNVMGQLLCRSRRRGIGYIGPYSVALPDGN